MTGLEIVFWRIVQGMMVKVVSEKFVSAGIIIGLQAISRRTKWGGDDKLTRELAVALGRADLLQD